MTALAGELDCVRQEVDQDLSDFVRITFCDSPIGLIHHLEVKLLLPELRLDEFLQAFQDVIDIDCRFFYVDMAGLDLCEIQYVIDEGEKVSLGAVDSLEVFPLLRFNLSANT